MITIKGKIKMTCIKQCVKIITVYTRMFRLCQTKKLLKNIVNLRTEVNLFGFSCTREAKLY